MVAALSTWIGLCAFIAIAFLKADTRLRPQYRAILSRWLRGESDATKNWATVIAALFDWLFKTSGAVRFFGLQLYLPNFWRALASSLLTVLVLGSLWYALLPQSAVLSLAGYYNFDVWGMEVSLPSVIGYNATELVDGKEVTFLGKQPLHVLVFYPLLSNIIVDYVSLIETRYVITLMEKNISKSPLYLIDDIVLTVLAVLIVGYASIVLGSIAFGLHFGSDSLKYYLLDNRLFEDFVFSPLIFFRLLSPEYVEYHITYAGQLSGVYGIFIYSTFLTSIWLWMFLFGFFLIRTIQVIPIVLKGVNTLFDLDAYITDKPLGLMGWILILIATMLFLASQLNI